MTRRSAAAGVAACGGGGDGGGGVAGAVAAAAATQSDAGERNDTELAGAGAARTPRADDGGCGGAVFDALATAAEEWGF